MKVNPFLALVCVILITNSVSDLRAAAPPVEKRTVTTKTVSGKKVVEVVWSSGKEITRYRRGEGIPYLQSEYDRKGDLVREREYSHSGKLFVEKRISSEEKRTIVYNPITGLPSFERIEYPRDLVEVIYGADGKRRMVTSSGGCLVGLVDFYCYPPGDKVVKRLIHGSASMSVTLSDKNDERHYFIQGWIIDHKNGVYVLDSIEQRTREGKRIIVMDKDGKKVDRIDYYKLGLSGRRLGYELERSEKSAEAIKNLDPALFKDPDPETVPPVSKFQPPR